MGRNAVQSQYTYYDSFQSEMIFIVIAPLTLLLLLPLGLPLGLGLS